MARKKSVAKVADTIYDNIPQGKPINNKSYEYVCNDCLEATVAQGNMFCVYDEKNDMLGRCACGKYTTIKAVIL